MDHRPLHGRVALVTGGGRGIGRAISTSLARAGAAVAVNYRRDAEAAARTVADIEAAGGTAKAYAGTVGKADESAALVATVTAAFGPVDLLVNNGGVASRGMFVADTGPDEVRAVMNTHALGVHDLCRLVLPGMRAAARGDIVMISSVATDHFSPGSAPYAMAKAAMEALARTLAKEEGGHGIRVNIVAPGLVATDMGDRLARATTGADGAANLDGATALGRVCRPEDIADIVRFLVSDAAQLITGQRVAVDGGGFVSTFADVAR